jgi:hypothetical protein
MLQGSIGYETQQEDAALIGEWNALGRDCGSSQWFAE